MSDAAAAVAWLRGQIEADRELAGHACDGDDGRWQVEHEGCDQDCPDPCPKAGECHAEHCWHRAVRGGGIYIYDEGGHDEWQAEHIARHDPADKLADCQAKLAILDAHPEDGRMCMGCPQTDQTITMFPCNTVELLASGYRLRDGYAEHWGDG